MHPINKRPRLGQFMKSLIHSIKKEGAMVFSFNFGAPRPTLNPLLKRMLHSPYVNHYVWIFDLRPDGHRKPCIE